MHSILFVDDDKRLLQGLRRLLADQRADWEMTFAASGEQAVGLLDLVEFDAVVSDLRMPGLDGVDVLRESLLRMPLGARLLLSGVARNDRHALADALVHRVLEKPCDPELLKLELRSALTWRDRLLERADPKLQTLWSMPPGCDDAAAALRVASEHGGGLPEDVVARLDAERPAVLVEALALLHPDQDMGAMSAFELAGRLGGRTLLRLLLALRLVELMAPEAPDWEAALDAAEQHLALGAEREGSAEALLAGLLAPSCAVGQDAESRDLLAYALEPWGLPAPGTSVAADGAALRRGRTGLPR